MKLIKINAIWCSACLIMNKRVDKLKKERNIKVIDIDYDMENDKALEYNPGNILPVLIFTDDLDKELTRLTGEVDYKKLLEVIDKLGDSK